MGVRRTALAGVMLLGGSLLTACQGDTAAPDPDPTTSNGAPAALRFMVSGPKAEVDAWRSVVKAFNDENPHASVSLVTVEGEDEVIAQLREGDVPDVFLLSRRDMPEVADAGINQPLEELLDTRGVDFGDNYKRDSLEAFARDRRLQCMPYSVSPMVMFLNKELVDWEEMAEAELPVPATHNFWSFTQFAAAAEFAAAKGKGIKGVHIEPSLRGLTPFVNSGGGKVYDDDRAPTSLALSEDDSVGALETALGLLRKGRITPRPKELRQKSALERFKDGRLGMIAGHRELVPELRGVEGLEFDVMPMPTIEEGSTTGEVDGLCLAADTTYPGTAADFIVHAISADSVSTMAETGSVVPTHNEVAESEAFLQPERMPKHAKVFNRSVRYIKWPPHVEDFEALEAKVHDSIYQLFYTRVLDIEALTEEIDEASRELLEPEESEDPASTRDTEETTDPEQTEGE